MSWTNGSEVLVEVLPIIQKHLKDDDRRTKILTDLIALFIKNDIDVHDISGADSEIDEILTTLYKDEESSNAADETNGRPPVVRFNSKKGEKLSINFDKDNVLVVKTVLKECKEIGKSKYQQVLETLFDCQHAKYVDELFAYFLSSEFEKYRSEAGFFFGYLGGTWDTLRKCFDSQFLKPEDVDVRGAGATLHSNGFNRNDYVSLAEIYDFQCLGEEKIVQNLAFAGLLDLLSRAAMCPKGCSSKHIDGTLKVGKESPCTRYCENISALIVQHHDKYKPDFNEPSRSSQFKWPFYLYAREPKIAEHLELLLKLGLNPNFRIGYTDLNFSQADATLLMAAAGHGNTKAVRLLLDHGAIADLKDDYDYTALDYAVRKNKKRAAAILEKITN